MAVQNMKRLFTVKEYYQMAEAGILGDYKGSQARECLLTVEQWERLRDSQQADRTGQSAADGAPTSC